VLLQVAAQSFDQLGAIDQSLKMYQRLYNLSDDAFVLFEIANQQYELKNYDEAMINTELLLGKSVVNNNMVVVKNAENKEIQVPFKAVVYNLQGLIARAQGNEESAKKYFNSALELAPDYALVKENLNTSK
jgi:tetratricopeptide (TPR) repeat protein